MEKQRAILNKRILKKAILELLKEKKIHDITINEICKKASINRATFYNYYDSPITLFEEIENDFIKHITDHLSIEATSQEMMFECLNDGLKYLKENKNFAKIIINNSVSEEFPSRLISVPNVKHAIKLTSDVVIYEHLKNYYSSFLIAGTYEVLKLWLNEDCKIDTEEIAALMISIGNKNQFKQDYISSTNTVSSTDKESNKNSSI